MINEPKEVARPERPIDDAATARAKEVYGKSAELYGFNKNKKDGSLMASGADWRNVHQQSTNHSSPCKGKNIENGLGTKDRKYQQL